MTSSDGPLLKTALNDLHRDLGAKLVPFAGWEMPLLYTGIVDEHHVVRKAAGLFDLAHMGRLWIRGADRISFLDGLVSNQVRDLASGRARYALMLNEAGCVLDDVIYYILDDAVLLVVNAANRDKVVTWLASHQAEKGLDVQVEDRTHVESMVAIQGPKSAEVLSGLTSADLSSLRYYRILPATVAGIETLIARTGYTGEDGFELYLEADRISELSMRLLEHGREAGVAPCGLGARDTLRTEAAMALYGHEIDEDTNPLEAQLDFAVKLDKGEFVGREALQQIRSGDGPQRRLRGFHVEGRRIPRPGYDIHRADDPEAAPVGKVTSGTHSPTLGHGICLAMVSSKLADDMPLCVDIRGTKAPLVPAALPFYKRPKK